MPVPTIPKVLHLDPLRRIDAQVIAAMKQARTVGLSSCVDSRG